MYSAGDPGFVGWFVRSWRGIMLTLGAFGTVMLVVLAVQHVAASEPAPGTQAAPIPTFTSPSATTVTFAAIGDSVTEENSVSVQNGQIGDASWINYANADGARFVGGWAIHGATTSAMLAGMSGPYHADVLVILAGTNDTFQNIPFATTAANLRQIVAKSGVQRIIISSIPPQDANPATPVAYNAQLQAFAAQNGWTFVDASSVLRNGDHYKVGLTADGIHPNQQGSALLGAALHKAIVGG